jgi:hypothetical protein
MEYGIMKVLSTEGLTKLIQLIKSAFISVDDTETTTEIDTVTTSEVTLATVATSGSYNDLTNKPTIPTVNNATLTITQGGVSKGTFTANASSDVTVDLDSGGSSLTAGTGIDITNDIISVEGVKDQRNASTAIKTWTGTRAQYDAIVSKDSNTLYNITDDTDTTLTLLEALYPVGSVYITTASTCPLSTLISGSSWSLVSSGRVLQGADSGHNAGTTIEAGLPNITGNYLGGAPAWITSDFSGALYLTNANVQNSSPQDRNGARVHFDASRSNAIYGNSNTVQPPAFVVNIWQRTA